MSFLVLLIVITSVSALARRHRAWKDHAATGFAGALVVSGVTHLIDPTPFRQHLPEWAPGEGLIVAASGIVEIGLGIALATMWRRRSDIGLVVVAYLVAVFPGNLYVALENVDVDGLPGGVARWVRLPLQAVFIAWVLWCTSQPTSSAGRLRLTTADRLRATP
jgi:uncharacterized membrane protein